MRRRNLITKYLRLIFVNEDAAYYQFPVFPDSDYGDDTIIGKKRENNTYVVQFSYSDEDMYELFLEDCNSNPHLNQVKDITEEEFVNAPSHGV